MRLAEPIAYGRTAEIYNWKEGWILKLSRDWVPAAHVAHEANLARAVHATGLPVPGVGEIVEQDGRTGIEYKKIEGRTLGDLIRQKPWTQSKQIELLVDLQLQIHAIEGPCGVPRLDEKLADKIQNAKGLDTPTKDACIAALREMPSGDRLCHGDFHPENVLISDRGPMMIDWIDAAVGAPAADVARTSVLAQGARAIQPSGALLQKGMLAWLHRTYKNSYFNKHRDRLADYKRWLPLIAAGRLSEGIEELEPWLVSQAEAIHDADFSH